MGSDLTTTGASGRLRPHAGVLAFAAAAVVVPLLFALYTGHIWEDFFITFRHSQNLCEGNGLVYRPGERVHGFTSPLGTLLPAACYLATGRSSYAAALWLFRVLSALAFAGGGVLLLGALRAGGAGRLVRLAFAALYLLNVKAVDFSINGMETGFMLLFVGWGTYLLVRDEPRRWAALGLCWAGLMWTRPDGCVYVAVLTAAGLLFATGPRRPRLAAHLKAAALCAALYLPWLLWAWAYYGSPVPNTIRAKANYDEGYHNLAETLLLTLERFPGRAAGVFRPTYAGAGGWPLGVSVLGQYLALFCSVYWLFPVRDRPGRLASFCFAALGLYLAFLTKAFSWYSPPVAAFGLLALTGGLSAYARSLTPGGRLLPAAVGAVLVLLIGQSAWTFAQVARQMKIQQREIEWGNRAPLGAWLKDHVAPGERVYVECLGYIGYFSGAKMLDYPGLVSPEVVRAAREGPSDFVSVGLRLDPEWMVLRPGEVEAMRQHPEFARRYERVWVFDVNDKLERYGAIPGKGYLLFDARFDVYRRRPGAAEHPRSYP